MSLGDRLGSGKGDRRADDYREHDPPQIRRPWALIGASLLLGILVIALWVKWAESRTEAARLRAELKEVYTEAESLRTQSAQAQRRVSLLEQQVRALTAERERLLNGLAGEEKPRARKRAPTRPRR
jgi:type VI protein secretion system component VasK